MISSVISLCSSIFSSSSKLLSFSSSSKLFFACLDPVLVLSCLFLIVVPSCFVCMSRSRSSSMLFVCQFLVLVLVPNSACLDLVLVLVLWLVIKEAVQPDEIRFF